MTTNAEQKIRERNAHRAAAAPAPSEGLPSTLGLALAALAPEDLAYLLIAAVRYQLPRMTYGSMLLCGVLRAVWPALTPNARTVLGRDIQDALDRDQAGQACDRDQWQRVLMHALVHADGVRRVGGA